MASLTLRKKGKHIRKGELPTASARPVGARRLWITPLIIKKARCMLKKSLEVMVILKYEKLVVSLREGVGP